MLGGMLELWIELKGLPDNVKGGRGPEEEGRHHKGGRERSRLNLAGPRPVERDGQHHEDDELDEVIPVLEDMR